MSRKKVMIIDDSQDVAGLMPIVLRENGIDVIISDSLSAMARLPDIKPNLILLDEIFGEHSASSICMAIKQAEALSEIPVVLVSAVADLDKIATECKADGFIEKPFDVIFFLYAVRSFL